MHESGEESHHLPIIVSAPVHHSHEIPASLEIHDDDRFLKTATDIHPIEPIHLVRVGDFLEPQIPKPPTHRGAFSNDDSPREDVFHGPVAVPLDYPYGSLPESENHYESTHRVSPGEYYKEEYNGDFSAIPGVAGIDYPTYFHMPSTGFKCLHHTSTPGFYADVETRCQMWHYCQPDGRHDRFLCPNGTIFDQITRVCNWWFNVYCDSSLDHYDVNFDLYREPIKLASLPQPLDETPYSSSPLQQSIGKQNSFLDHLADFEAGNLKLEDDYYLNERVDAQSAAIPKVHKYPAKLAPSPKVRLDQEGFIDYDSSNAHTHATPIKQSKSALVQHPRKKKRISRRKKKLSKKTMEDIPTYREAKATPPPSKRYRLVRRRKTNKELH